MSTSEVRQERRKYELSQAEVASALGVSRASYNYFEFRGWRLPGGLTDKDALDAIARLSDRSRLPESAQEVLP